MEPAQRLALIVLASRAAACGSSNVGDTTAPESGANPAAGTYSLLRDNRSALPYVLFQNGDTTEQKIADKLTLNGDSTFFDVNESSVAVGTSVTTPMDQLAGSYQYVRIHDRLVQVMLSYAAPVSSIRTLTVSSNGDTLTDPSGWTFVRIR
jgi:hypothetical protein